MLRVAQSELAAIRAHAERDYPRECCGVLLGHAEDQDRVASSVIACRNASTESPHTRYCIDPAELIRVQRESRARGLEIVGFYHSHPDHPVQWSPRDLAEAYWPACSYLIVSVHDGRAGEVKSFTLQGTEKDPHFEEERIIEPPA